MIRRLVVAWAVFAAVVVNVATAETVVDVDLALVTNGGVGIFGDHFDDGVLGSQWIILNGSPGPETGTVLRMAAGDTIGALLSLDPALTTTGQVLVDLTEFPAGSWTGMALFGDEPLESMWLGVTPESVVLQDGTGGLVAFAPLDPGPQADLILIVNPGWLTAIVDGQVIHDGPSSFGPVTALGIAVLPEPSSLALLGIGFIACIRRTGRRPNRS